MAGFNGEELTIDYESTTLVGVNSKSFNIANDLVDVTTDDDDNFATFLPKPGRKALTGTVSGITSDEVIIAAVMSTTNVGGSLTVNLPSALASPGSIVGTMLWQSIEVTGNTAGAVEFTAQFTTTGAYTFTPSSA